MFKRQRTGAVLCPSCGKLVGASEKECPFCGRSNPGMFGMTSWFTRLGREFAFVDALTLGCVLMYVLTLVVDINGVRFDGFVSFMGPSTASLLRFGASGKLPVVDLHRWWTILAAGWLHAGLLHIALNVYGVRLLAPAVAELYGASRTVIIYTAGAVAGFALSTAAGLLPGAGPLSLLTYLLGQGDVTIGASAPLMGLVGALAYYGRRGSSHIGNQGWTYAVSMLVYGLVLRGSGIDNWAHIGGFAGGYLVSHLLNPMQPERGNHVVLAFVCLAASAAAIVASLVVPLPPGLLQR